MTDAGETLPSSIQEQRLQISKKKKKQAALVQRARHFDFTGFSFITDITVTLTQQHLEFINKKKLQKTKLCSCVNSKRRKWA